MQKHLVVLGAGGFAREMYWHIQGTHPGARVAFVDDVSEVREVLVGSERVPVVKDWNFRDVQGAQFHEFVLGIGNPATKKKMVERALASGLTPAPTIVHPRALVQGTDCKIGVGGIIAPGCILTTNVQFGDYVLLNLNCTIGHDAVIGDYSTCNPGCQISGNVTLGEGVVLGTGTAIRDKMTIAPGVVTGAQTCIVKDIGEPDITVIGVPAKKLG
jgi:sugar O-acyltransferase (sialic acid O-acetyltransferase NeuD family)